jgi:RNA polymerase primary sigma factor
MKGAIFMSKRSRTSTERKQETKEKIKILTDGESLRTYINEINKIELLSREEEDDLARRMASGDEKAKEKLINANLRFVVKIAKKYMNKGLPLVDLINEGNMGLIMACKKFDYKKGYHFISYAVWWIRQSIAKAIAEQVGMIRLPLNRYLQLAKIKKVQKEKNISDDEIDAEEIADFLNTKEDYITDILKASKSYVSLDNPVANDKKEIRLEDVLLDTKNREPVDVLYEKNLKEVINTTLKTLTEREQLILKHRFGLDNHEELSLSEIGKMFNLTKERIRQIEKKAIRRLRHKSRSQYLKKYLLS